jgi:hypothetical protein
MILCVIHIHNLGHSNYVISTYVKTNLRVIATSVYTRSKLSTRLSEYDTPYFCALRYYE